MRKKKTAIVSVLLGILLIGIVSAGLIDYFVRITGEVTVEEPILYPNGHIAQKYYQLQINEIPDEEELILIDGENIIFTTGSLGIDNFYEADYTIYIRAKTNVENNKLWAELWTLDENENYKQQICPGPLEFEIGATTNFWTYDETCSGNQISMEKGDRIALKVYGAGETTDYKLNVGDYTDSYPNEDKIMRVEVTATWNTKH